MFRWFVRRKLAAEEKKLGGSLDYLRHIVGVSRSAFLRFAGIMPFANSRRDLPKDVWYTAQLIAVQHEDCGPCLQITVNLARKDGVDPGLIQAVLNGDRDQLPSDLSDVCEFAHLMVTNSDTADTLREAMRTRYGDRGVIELAYAIAAGRIPPTVKRVLGYAKSCRDVTITTEPDQANQS